MRKREICFDRWSEKKKARLDRGETEQKREKSIEMEAERFDFFALFPSLSLSFAHCIAERRKSCVPWRGEGARRAKRENARRKKRRVPAPLSRKRWLPSLSFLPRGAKEKKNERGLLDLLLLRPATSRGAEGMTSARLSRSRREQRDKGRGSKRVQRLVIRSLTHHPASERSERWQCIHQISLFSLSTLEKTALTRPSAVPGWRVPRRPPLLVRVAKKKKKWGRRGVKRKKLSLSL